MVGVSIFYIKKSIFEFFKRRIIRIFPLYIIICFIYIIIINGTAFDYFICVTTFGFWTGNLWYDWYIPAILLFYLLYPLIAKLLNKFGLHFVVILALLILGIISYLQISTDCQFADIRMFALSRFPAFVLGAYCGYLTIQNKEGKYLSIVFAISGILGFILYMGIVVNTHFSLLSGVRKFLHILYAPGLCFLFSAILALSYKYMKIVNAILSTCGKMSLELYLIHVKFFDKMPFFDPDYRLVYGLTIVSLTFLLAYAVNKILQRFNKMIL